MTEQEERLRQKTEANAAPKAGREKKSQVRQHLAAKLLRHSVRIATSGRPRTVARLMAGKRVLIKEESEKAKKKRPEMKIEYEVKSVKRAQPPVMCACSPL
jgi:hypothetical protein